MLTAWMQVVTQRDEARSRVSELEEEEEEEDVYYNRLSISGCRCAVRTTISGAEEPGGPAATFRR